MANARDELKELEKVVIEDHYKDGWNITLGEVYEEKCIHIEEHLHVLEIIVKKQVDVNLMVLSFEKQKPLDFYNIMCPLDLELTQEEYDFVSKVVEEIVDEKN